MNKITKPLERLASRLKELESQLDLDIHEAISQFEEHCQHLRGHYRDLPIDLRELKKELGADWHEMKDQLDELEVQLTLARMETVDEFRERRDRIIKTLNALEDNMRKIELAKDNEGLLQYKDFVGVARKLEDKIGALDVHFKLSTNHIGEALDREKESVKKVARNAAEKIKVLEGDITKKLQVIEEGIRKASVPVWDLAKGFIQYEETEEERRRKREMDSEVPD